MILKMSIDKMVAMVEEYLSLATKLDKMVKGDLKAEDSALNEAVKRDIAKLEAHMIQLDSMLNSEEEQFDYSLQRLMDKLDFHDIQRMKMILLNSLEQGKYTEVNISPVLKEKGLEPVSFHLR